MIGSGIEDFGKRILMKFLMSLGKMFFAIIRGRIIFLKLSPSVFYVFAFSPGSPITFVMVHSLKNHLQSLIRG